MNDVPEHKRVMTVNKVNEFKQDVIAAVSHDLKTPLHNVLTHLELAEGSNDLT
jgi:signal transduction histidine kinase